ncbi:MAG: hypothetical protein ACTHWQ_02300 [Sphingobacterium sp.]
MTRYCFLLSVFMVVSGFAQGQLRVDRIPMGKLTSPALGEVSGMIPSERYPSSIWVHNDSGDDARIYLVDSLANLIGTVKFQGIQGVDIEDIAWVKIEGQYHLVLADIGDNRGCREELYLYILKEPEGVVAGNQVVVPRTDIRICTLRFADHPRDAEAIFVDPEDQTLFLISKRDFRSTLYAASVFQDRSRSSYILRPQIQLPFTFVTAADISQQRDGVLIKNLTSIYYWSLSPAANLLESLNQPATALNYQAEPQGEALAFDSLGDGFFTLSERPLGLDAYLYFYTFQINTDSL